MCFSQSARIYAQMCTFTSTSMTIQRIPRRDGTTLQRFLWQALVSRKCFQESCSSGQFTRSERSWRKTLMTIRPAWKLCWSTPSHSSHIFYSCWPTTRHRYFISSFRLLKKILIRSQQLPSARRLLTSTVNSLCRYSSASSFGSSARLSRLLKKRKRRRRKKWNDWLRLRCRNSTKKRSSKPRCGISSCATKISNLYRQACRWPGP